MIERDKLQRFMREFLGYGSPSASVWFIGMEEGGGHSEQEIADRLDGWESLQFAAIVDAPAFHRHFGPDAGGTYEETFFGPAARIQSTWGPLIRLALSMQGQSNIQTADVREFQQTCWGRSNSNSCLIELLPLPSPGSRVWRYAAWTDVPSLASRALYERATVGQRISLIQSSIETYRPRHVVFYGVGHEEHWSAIVGESFRRCAPSPICQSPRGKMLSAKIVTKRGVSFVSIPHPSRLKQSSYFHMLGRVLQADSREAR